MIRTSIAIPRPFDARWMLGFLRARQAPAIERIDEKSITRTIRVGNRPAVMSVRIGAARITAECSADMTAEALRAIVIRVLDLDANLEAFAQCAGRDRLLASLLRARPGLRVPQFLDPFECVVRAVLGQQVSVRAASTRVNRLAIAFGADLTVGPFRGFPSADQLADAGADRLQRIGLTRARAASLHAVATAVADRRVDLEALRTTPGEDGQAILDALPGIGPWTASYIRMRGFGDRDAFPAGDLGVRKALGLTAAEAERRSQRWRPWRAYAVMHLWNSSIGQP